MLVQVAYVVAKADENEWVLRAAPEEVRYMVEHVKGEILFSVEEEVHEAEEEYVRLWVPFYAEAAKYEKSELAQRACDLFFKKGKNLWTTFLGVPNVAIFPLRHDDMTVLVSKNAAQ